jgi:hypothetical protein
VLLEPVNPAEVPDVVVLNELGTLALQTHVRRLMSERVPDVWASAKWHSDGSRVDDRDAVMIVWRAEVFQYIRETIEILHGGKSGVTPTRVVRRVLLEHRATRKRVWRQGTHTVHGVERNGVAFSVIPGQLDRAEVAFPRIAADVLEAAVTAPVEGSGDLNVDALAEAKLPPAKRTPWFPMNTIGKVAAFANPPRGTHGNRCIDQRWIRGRIRVLSIAVLPKRSSDHNPVLAIVELT